MPEIASKARELFDPYGCYEEIETSLVRAKEKLISAKKAEEA